MSTLMPKLLLNNTALQWLAVLFGLAIALFQIQHQGLLIEDTFLYLKTAVIYQDEGFTAAMRVYPWPFYSVLLATLATTTGLSLLTTAYLANLIFQSWLLWIWLEIIKCFDKSTLTLLCAAIVFLVYSRFNTLRPDVLRDFAYLACLFTALWSLLRYSETQKHQHLIFWLVMSAIATLFRVEGIVLLLLMPLVILFFKSWTLRQRIKGFIIASMIPIGLFMGLITVVFYAPGAYLGRLQQLPFDLLKVINTVFSKFAQSEQIIAQQILPSFSANHSDLLLLTGLVSVFFVVLLKSLTSTYVVLAIHSIYTKVWLMQTNKTKVLITFIVINLLISCYFFAVRYFIISRYFMAMDLAILVGLSLSLATLVKQVFAKDPQAHVFEKGLLIIVSIGIATSLLKSFDINIRKSIHHGNASKYAHLKEAGLWLNRRLPNTAVLYSNDDTVSYYASRDQRAWLKRYAIQDRPLPIHPRLYAPDQWLALNLPLQTQQDAQLMEQIKQIPGKQVAVFRNYRGDSVQVLRVSNVGLA